MKFLFLDYVVNLGPWIYPLLFAGMFIEGEAFLLIAAFAASQKLLPLGDILLVSLIGIFVGDNLWYCLGRSSARFLSPLRYIAEKVTNPFLDRIKNTPFWFILITKFTYGVHHLTLARAGMMKIPVRDYLKIVALADVIWVVAITSLGYFFGASFEILSRYLKYGEVGLLLGLIGLVVIERLIRRLANEKV